ncbi:GNAT family N-acetyltransferase [Lysinibacillus sp. IITD104]|uniref:GNAT family N-acetyltransferase n=1 Tax=Lysinibacillus sp. IITD104 TaxID=3116650 RepID=UPI002FCF57F1
MKMIHSSKIHPEVKTLLSYATSEKKVEKEYSLYIACPERVLYGYTFAQDTIGCIGIVNREANRCEIKHIAVSPAYRGKDIGREMIRYVEEHHAFSSIYAETDQEAVLFYKNIGFHITSLGEKYPGVERFACLLNCTT